MVPFAVQGIDHVVYRVHDVEGMVAFYWEVLGCPVAHRQPHLGLVHLRVGGAQVDLVRSDGDLPAYGHGNVAHLCLRVDPWEPAVLRAHFQRHGIPVTWAESNFGAGGIGPSLYLQDPEGNVLELKGPARGSGEPES